MPGKDGAKKRSSIMRSMLCFVGLLVLLSWQPAPVKAYANPKRILVLYWYNKDFPSNAGFDRSFQAVLRSAPIGSIEYYSEYVESNLFPGEKQDEALRDYLRQKYAHRSIDVVVAFPDVPLEFLLKYRDNLFPQTPIVFVAIKRPAANEPSGPGLTGIVLGGGYRKTLDLALKLHPGTKQVFVISGTLNHDKTYENLCREEFQGLDSRISINYLTDLSVSQLIFKTKRLPERSLVLYIWQQIQNEQGQLLESADVLTSVAPSTTAPIYGVANWQIGRGIVGGYLRSFEDDGTRAAGIALQVANGVRAQDLPIESAMRVPVFDWGELHRWGLKEGDLPPGSVVLNRPPTVWMVFRWYILGGTALILLEALLISALIRQRSTRKKAETELGVAYDRLRLAMIYGKSSAWDLDVKTGRRRLLGDLQTIFGIQSDDYTSDVADFYRSVHPEDRQRVQEAVADAKKNHKQYGEEFRVLRKDGTVRWLTATGKFYYSHNGEPERMLGVAVDITDRKHSEEALRKSEEKFAKAFRQGPMAVTLTGASDRYLDVNETFEQITGWRRDEVIGRTRYEIGICVDSAYRVEFAKRILNDGAVRNMEVNFHCKDGTEKIGLSSAEIIEIEGEPCILSVIADITERRRLEEAQRQSEERLHLAVQAGKMYAYEWDAKTGVVIRSPECADVLGPDQPIQTTFQDVMAQIHPEDRIGVDEPGSGLTPEDPNRQVSYRLLRPDGSVLWLEKSARAFFDDQGKLRRTVGVVADITERKHAEEALRSSEERFRRVVENIGDALVVDDVAGHVVFVNDRFLSLFGFRRGQLPILKLEDYIAPEYRAGLRDRHDRRMRGESVPSHFEYEGIRPDGRRMWLEVDVVPIADPTGKLVGTQSAVRDITDRKQAENAVRESEERFRLVANTAPVMIWMSGIDKLCTYFNKPWLEFVGRSFEDELGDGWASGVHPDDLANCLKAYSEAFDRAEPFEIYYRLRRHDGEYRWILDTGVPRFSADGTFAGYIGSCLDITERKLAEEAMAGVSRRLIEAHEQERTWVARELHDDINQQIALLSIELDRYAQHLPESAADLQGEIRHLSKRLSDIANGVQALSHRLHSSKLEYLGLTTAGKSFCKELSEQQNIRVEFNHFDVPPNIPQEIALCLFRVLQEALQNAVKHSGTRKFRVELRGAHEEIRLTVSDSGVGFRWQGALDRHGLGLISMRERLLLVNGEFEIKSQPGAGTTICARIPLKQAEQHRAMTG